MLTLRRFPFERAGVFGVAGAVGLPFRSFFAGNLLGAVLFVPYAVGIGYAIGYGLGPYVAHLQHTLGGIGRSV